MKNINYYGQEISVSDEVAEFLEQDRRRDTAQGRSDQRHLDYVGVDIASIPDLFTNADLGMVRRCDLYAGQFLPSVQRERRKPNQRSKGNEIRLYWR